MARKGWVKARVKPKMPAEISFDYIKSNLFRVVTVDGAYGGIGPNGKTIHMALYTERRPIPRKTVHPINEQGIIGGEDHSRKEARSGYIREVEIDVAISLETAIALQIWLQEKIVQLAKHQGVEMVADGVGVTLRQEGGKPKKGDAGNGL